MLCGMSTSSNRSHYAAFVLDEFRLACAKTSRATITRMRILAQHNMMCSLVLCDNVATRKPLADLRLIVDEARSQNQALPAVQKDCLLSDRAHVQHCLSLLISIEVTKQEHAYRKVPRAALGGKVEDV